MAMTQIELEMYNAVVHYCRNAQKSKMERQDEYVANAAKDILCALIQSEHQSVEELIPLAVRSAEKLSENFFSSKE